MDHEHQPMITLEGQLKCRTCGDFLPEAKEEITTVGSKSGARDILEQMAIDGGYSASYREGGFIVFSREKGSVVEEITIERYGVRDYRIVKKYSVREVTH